jgi:hypothetical protein
MLEQLFLIKKKKWSVNLIIFGSKNIELAVKIIIGSKFCKLIFWQ